MLYNNKTESLLLWLIGIGDLILLNIIFFVMYYTVDSHYTTPITHRLRETVLLFNFCYFFALYLVPITVHHSVIFLDKIAQRSLLLITIQTLLFATCILFLSKERGFTMFIICYYITVSITFALWRILVRLIVKLYRRKGYDSKNILIIGAGKNGMELYRIIDNDLSYGFNVLGFFDDNEELQKELTNYLGKIDQMESFVLNHRVDEIYCTIPGANSDKISSLLAFAEKNMIRFYIIPDFYRNVKKSMILEIMETVPLLSIRNEPLQSAHNRVIKRTFDITFSFLILLLVYPLLYLIIATFIKISSPGPILFKQKRTGLYGKEFECYKFRTMKVNKEADTVQAIKDDPRTTKIGRFLRQTNLDEFPQFVNVFMGDMSVVGPRPHMLKHTELYSQLIDKYMVRHLVKPGITGWAQIMGYRGETRTLEQMEGRVKRDVWYIENWSFFLDLKIIYVTTITMFKGDKNAY